MRIALAAVAALLLAGCGSSAPRPALRGPIRPAEWKAVLGDWYDDGVVDHRHPCAAIVLARTHLPVDGPMYSTVDRDLARAERRFCSPHASLDALRKGMSDADVAALAGVPRNVYPGCWLYPPTGERSGRRVCFTRGRVTSLQLSVHL